MKHIWHKATLPMCWDIKHASLPLRRKEDNGYMIDTYHYVSKNYDGQKPLHHLALIIAIFFSQVAPDIFFDKMATAQIQSRDGPGVTSEIRELEWLPTKSSSHRGTVTQLPFIVMVSTALIGFWDSDSPFSKHLRSNVNKMGDAWTEKHGMLYDLSLCRFQYHIHDLQF
jgi:hypothetical protein